MNDKKIQIIIAVVVSVLIAGGGVFLWQQSGLNKVKAERDALQQQIDEFTKEPERYVKIVSPNGGEQLCLGESFVINWLSRDVNAASLDVLKLDGADTSRYTLATVSLPTNAPGESTKGDFVWKIGEVTGGKKLKEGYGYKIEITSAEGDLISDTSDSVFQILSCKE